MIVKPAPGLVVRDPVTKRLLPEKGIKVSDTDFFWRRALNDGDVVKASVADAAATKPAAATPAALTDGSEAK